MQTWVYTKETGELNNITHTVAKNLMEQYNIDYKQFSGRYFERLEKSPIFESLDPHNEKYRIYANDSISDYMLKTIAKERLG